ncbi:MAG: SEL1-like repeat protein [Clostridia bacterium]|nr:SEL1-like repeat protein [Clostridia bacterium]
MKRLTGAVLLIVALAFALSAYADSTWTCGTCGRRVQAALGDTCPYCGARRHVHTWRDATCTEPKTCGECGATEGKALGHQWDGGTVIQEANCRTIGVKSYTCTVCGAVRDERIPKDPANHTGGTETKGRRDATCTADGYTGDTCCKSCGELIVRGSAIPAAGHQWDEGTVIQEATCQSFGIESFVCRICGTTRNEVIQKDPSNHTGGTETRFAKEATAADDGYTGDTYCRGCGELIGKGSRIAALGDRKAAELGDPDAQFRLGNMYYFGRDVAQDYPEAAKWWRRAAEQGHAGAQANLGWLYERGYGVSQSYEEAAKWYRKAAEQGNMKAQFNLGVLYENGNGVAQNYEEAAKWYRKAAEQGNMNAQFNLGVLYANGNGVAQNYEEAVKWYRKAAEQGYASAQNNLGVLYKNGNGVPQSYDEAAKWYRKAAEQGEMNAQNNLGWLYEKGYGVAQSYEEAAKWYRKAAEQGNTRAQKNLDRLYENHLIG